MSKIYELGAHRKLNVGCGRMSQEGWTNIDIEDIEGVDIVCDVQENIPLPDDSAEIVVAAHLIEHLDKPLDFMQELHRVTKPGGRAYFYTPYGSSDDADEDPTHIRRMFLGSWGYFGQPNYWKADYGYRGDWKVETVFLQVDASRVSGLDSDLATQVVRSERNVVYQMIAKLICVKPIRPPEQTGDPLQVEISGVTTDQVFTWYENLHV